MIIDGKEITPMRGVYSGRVIEDDFLYGSFSDLDKLVDSSDVNDRLRAVELGYGLDKLKDDADPRVRAFVSDALNRVN